MEGQSKHSPQWAEEGNRCSSRDGWISSTLVPFFLNSRSPVCTFPAQSVPCAGTAEVLGEQATFLAISVTRTGREVKEKWGNTDFTECDSGNLRQSFLLAVKRETHLRLYRLREISSAQIILIEDFSNCRRITSSSLAGVCVLSARSF